MYILKRKAGEGIRISKDVTVYILSVSGNEVKLGIDAPKDVPIVRLEILSTTQNASRAFNEEKLREILKDENQGA
jgi:carbon storage regulator